MPSLSLPAAELASVFLGTLLYGFYLGTLTTVLPILLTTHDGQWKRRTDIRWLTVGVSVILCLNVAVNLAVAIWRNFNALVLNPSLSGEEAAYILPSSWQNVVTAINVGLQSLTGDLILIYRCWLVFSRSRKIIVLPLLLWIAAFVCEARIVSLQTTDSQAIEHSAQEIPWGKAFWTLTLAINILTTGMIIVHIWRVDRHRLSLFGRPSSALGRAMRNIGESGLLYTVAVILSFAAYTTQSTLVYLAGTFEIHSVGIAFNWIIIRTARTRVAHPSHLQEKTISAIQFRLSQTTQAPITSTLSFEETQLPGDTSIIGTSEKGHVVEEIQAASAARLNLKMNT
ncbi:hypothetical protein B0H16DRAFT_1562538 [Mycena metata]|uniref:Uncharacterized protein n=1 Tax=Mycena metata TaxID=1033252 RepID=A0AAD7IJ83_9AGAR|nr:hypothetical protein B0H16DRAFT_1562538 [Mycena metata]